MAITHSIEKAIRLDWKRRSTEIVGTGIAEGTRYSQKGDIGEEFRKRMGEMVVMSSWKRICRAARIVVETIQEYRLPFYEVTGNLAESIGVVVIGTNRRRDTLTVGRQYAPAGNSRHHIREPLARGEMFDKPVYKSGMPATGPQGNWKPFIATTEGGTMTGSQQRMQYIKHLRTVRIDARNTLFTLYAFAAMPYANEVNINKHEKLKAFLYNCLKMGWYK